ncbi:MAG: OprO/OprP family phosphate-selective porin [Burkholderiales bacterium]|nr:OprO/OprP family phosphate-selective porin [Burkholderiales bacterium]
MTAHRRRAAAVAMVLSLCGVDAAHAVDNEGAPMRGPDGVAPAPVSRDTEDELRRRIDALERALRTMAQELEALRAQVGSAVTSAPTAESDATPAAVARDAAAGAAPPVVAVPAPAPTAATAPSAATDAAVAAGPDPLAELAKTRRELSDQRYEALVLKERVDTLQGRLDQQVPNVRLAEGVLVEDPRGRWQARLTARAQFDYRDFAENGVLADTFSVRRARIGLGFNLGRTFAALVEGEFAAGQGTQAGQAANAVLHQAWVDFVPSDQFRLRVGQFRPNFGLDTNMTTWQTDFIERSLASNVVQGLANNVLFDRGLMLSGVPTPGALWSVGITNGTGTGLDRGQRNSSEARIDGKEVTVRVVGNAAQWASLSDWVLHFGGTWRQATLANGVPGVAGQGFVAPSAITESRGITFFNPVSFNSAANPAADPSVDRRVRSLEGAIAWRNVKLQGEWTGADYVFAPTGVDQVDRGIRAGYLQAIWMPTGEFFSDAYRNGLFARVRPNNQFGTGPGTGWGAFAIGLRWSFWDGSDFATRLAGNTLAPVVTQSAREADAWTIGLKWMPTTYVAYMINLITTRFDTPVVANGIAVTREDAVVMRAQFDFF